MRFLFDNNICPAHATALNALCSLDGHSVTHFRDKFAPSTRDEVWLPALAKEAGWIVASGDLRIFRSPQIRRVWIDSKLTTFFLSSGWLNLKPWEQAWRLVRWWPQVIAAASVLEKGTRLEIPLRWRQGKLKSVR